MPLLMIPGPIEVSPAVVEAASGKPPGHLAAHIIEAFGLGLERMRDVWMADSDAQPFIVAGSGTLAMEMAVTNLLDPGQKALVVNTGYFSDRIADMLVRRGVEVIHVKAKPGDAPTLEEVDAALTNSGFHALFATHVDTSTGVRVDAAGLAQLARKHDALSVFDGVCATAGERFEMANWGADLYLTGSQKAIGLPAGLALLVASKRAMGAREALKQLPPMTMDFYKWLPIMKAYEARERSYFATPATTLINALPVSLSEILKEGMDAHFARHEATANAMRAAWACFGLKLLPVRPEIAANTLSAIYYPEGVDAKMVAEVKARDVIIAGGLHPALKTQYFRVGHMGHILTQPSDLETTIRAVGDALCACGHAVDVTAGVEAFRSSLGN